MMMATYFSMSFTGSGLESNCGLDQHIEHFAFGIDGAPKIDHAAIDYQIDFVQVPSCMGIARRPGAALGRPWISGLIARERLDWSGPGRGRP
jgi:hypothetical protein